MAHLQIGDDLAAGFAEIIGPDIGAHFGQCFQKSGPGWVHHDVFNLDFRARNDESGHNGKGGRGRVARDIDFCAGQMNRTCNADHLTFVFGAGRDFGAKGAQHVFRMIAGKAGFANSCCAVGFKAGQKNGGLYLSRRVGRREIQRL